MTNVPEPEALQQHADSLAPLGHAVQTPVELQVLECRQLAVDERLVAEITHLCPLGFHAQFTVGRKRETGANAQERRLAGAVRPGDDGEAAAVKLEVNASQHALFAEALTELARGDHVSASP